MIKEALAYLIGIGNARTETVGTQSFSTQPYHLIPEPAVAPITVNTLSGLVDYLNSTFDGIDSVLVHVEGPTKVSVYSHLTRDNKRGTWIEAVALLPSFRFDYYYDAESFNIKLQSMFTDSGSRTDVLKVVGNIRDEKVGEFGDDGVSQKVTAKTGVATVADVKVPNPVSLSPFRTFIEVEQPASNFVLRMKSGPECALFEADGGAWKQAAINNIKSYLTKSLCDGIVSGRVTILA